MILVAIFGVFGVLCRYGADQFFSQYNEKFPYTTLSVNLLGCLIAGCVFAVSDLRNLSTDLQTAIVVGFCGGFTTFSAYALQSLLLIDRGRPLVALTYLAVSPILGLLAAALPVLIARKFLG